MAAVTKLGLTGTPVSQMNSGRYDGKTVASAFQTATLIWQFDLWREGYAGAVVEIFKEGTTTYADVYTDINLSTPADNPQVLITQTLNSRTYGRFLESLYTPDPYYLSINGVETSGVSNPGIRTLNGEEADDAEVTSNEGGIARTLADRAADTIHVKDFGNFLEVDGSTSQNTTTLTAAIGAASAANGGEVILPAGTYRVSTFTLPANVSLRGQGRDATILQSVETDVVVEVTGDDARLADLCLDGVSLESGSVGVFSRAVSRFRINEVTVKRFETGVKHQGGTDHHYDNLFVQNCGTCVELRGDTDDSNTEEGSSFTDLTWNGGSIEESTTYGLYLRWVDAAIEGLTIRDLTIADNVGTAAMYIQGAEQAVFEDLIFSGSTVRHLLTADVTLNAVENLEFRSCQFTASEIKLGGSCRDTVFDRCILDGALSINADGPTYPIMFRDAREGASVTQTGNTDKISRWTSVDEGVFKAQTLTSVSTATVFKRQLNPGEIAEFEIVAAAVQTNVAAWFTMQRTAVVYCPPAQLPFDAQTVNFTAGNTLTGGTSRATAVIQSQTDAGATGSLNLIRLTSGATTGNLFQDNEALTGSGGGAATVDGTLTYQSAVLLPPLQTDHYTYTGTGPSSWSVDVTTNNREALIKVVGPTTGTVDWNVTVRQHIRG